MSELERNNKSQFPCLVIFLLKILTTLSKFSKFCLYEIICPNIQKFSLGHLMLTVNMYHYNCKCNSLIFSVQKIWSPSFLLVRTSISIRTTCLHLDDSPTLSPTSHQKWVYLVHRIAISSCSNMKHVQSTLCLCQLITYLMCSFRHSLNLKLILYCFVIAKFRFVFGLFCLMAC